MQIVRARAKLHSKIKIDSTEKPKIEVKLLKNILNVIFK